MDYLSIEELVNASKGHLVSKSKEVEVINELVIDSRLAKKNNVFFAIIGESLDGHKFINSAIENGCKTIIKNESNDLEIIGDDLNIIEVENTEFALGDISRYYKNKFDIPYIGVTGSVGKTSTRDMVYAAVSSKYKTLKNTGNLNNQFGVPLTLANLDKSYECAVIEMGMSGFNEIEYLVNIVNPKIGVISNIGLSHVERLGSREGIFKAKMEITTNFDESCTLIVNGDDDMLATLKGKELNYNLKTFGFEKDNTIYCVDFEMNDSDTTFNVMIDENIENQYNPENTHDIWEENSVLDEKTLKEFTEKFVSLSQKGEIPNYLGGLISALKNSKGELPWNLYLKKLMGTVESNKKKTITRRNRRQPNRLDLRGELRNHKAEIAVAIDISGSISDEEFKQAIKEVLQIVKNYNHEITIIECDNEIRRTYKVKSVKDIKERINIRGGTKFTPVFEYANKKKLNLLVYFTDGKGEDRLEVIPRGYKVLWVISGRGDKLSLKEPYGAVKKLSKVEVKDNIVDMKDVRNDGYSMNNQEPIF